MSSLTTIQALSARMKPYLLPSDFFQSVMIGRGLDGEAECTQEVLASTEYKGAVADCLRQLVIHPQSISEGGMSISKADLGALMNEANRLYRSIGEEPIDERPKITCY